MATKPTNLAVWATGAAPITEPLLAEKQAGFAVASKPPAQWFNWWMKAIHLWIVWLDAFESTVHTWTALQTFNAGVCAHAFGDTAGIRGISAISGVPGVLGSATTGVAPGVRGETSSGTGLGGRFVNTATTGGGIGVQGEGRYGGNFIGSYWAGVSGSLNASAGDPSAAGVIGRSSKLDRPGVSGRGDPSQGAWGGEFIGADSEESSTPGGLGLYFRGGMSSIMDTAVNAGDGMVGAAGDATGDGTLGQSGSGGTNTLRGGNVDGLVNDEGLPGVGLTITGGSVTGDSNGRVGATALKLIAGDGAGGRGLSVDADGDMRLNGQLEMVGADKAVTDPQTNLLTAGLVVKAWARIRISSGVYQLLAGQNIASLVAFPAPINTQFSLNLAAAVPRSTRIVIARADLPDKDLYPNDYGRFFGASDTVITFEVINRPTDGSAVTTVNLNTDTVVAHIIILGLQ